MPANISFSGIVRQKKILFMLEAVRSLGLAYRFIHKPEYAVAG
jgi:hypothetical protein